MTTYAFLDPLTEIPPAAPFAGPDGRQYSASWPSLASDADRTAAGIAAVVETDRPTGKKTATPGLQLVDGVPTRTWVTTNYSAPERTALRSAKLESVKVEARRRILARWPEWKQLNMNARATQLTRIRLDRPWTEAEAAEAAALEGAWAWIVQVRAASDAIEATVPTDAAGIEAFNPATAEGWPA
jgi:hypothetical protein